MEVSDRGRATARITFPESAEVFAGALVFPTLLRCVQLTADALSLVYQRGTRPYPAA